MMTDVQETVMALTSVVAKATLILALGWCFARVLRRATAGARHVVWLITMTGVLLVLASVRVAPIRVGVLPRPTTVTAVRRTVERPNTAPRASADLNSPTSHQRFPATVFRAVLPSPRNIETVAIRLWLGVSGAFIAWLVLGNLSIRRVARRGRVLDSPAWTTALREAASRLNLAAMPRLVASDEVEMAFACNVLAATIVLPAAAEGWSDDRRRAVLLHELAHIRRRDLVGHTIARFACAMYWFHPGVWIGARRLRAESELACDDLVLESGVQANDYAQHLLEMVIAVGHRTGAPSGALTMARRNEFEGRLLAVLDNARERVTRRAEAIGLAGALGLLSISIAAVAPIQRTQVESALQQPRESRGPCSVFAYTSRFPTGCTSNGDVIVMSFDSNHVMVSTRDTADIHLSATDVLILRLRNGTVPPNFGWYARMGRSTHTDSVLYLASTDHQTIALRFAPSATVSDPDAQIIDVESSLSALHSNALTWDVLPRLATAPHCTPSGRPARPPSERLTLGGVSLDGWRADEPLRGCILVGDTRVEFPLT